MSNLQIPLKDITVFDLYNGETATYEIPIYQRNYAWEKEEISALVQDVFNAFSAQKKNYYIGTLVSFYKGDQVYEIIDGQQRLTTIFLILNALGIPCSNRLTYKARRKASETILHLNNTQIEDKDYGILRGASCAEDALSEIVTADDIELFKEYFQRHVRIIHYQVPKDIDLNHYFEIMNSRGEQLEMSEIIKARLMEKLNDTDKAKFSRLWECCSEMNVYVQQRYDSKTEKKEDVKRIFGPALSDFMISSFDDLPVAQDSSNKQRINDILTGGKEIPVKEEISLGDSFQPIMDFPNFLLIVLKLTRIDDPAFELDKFILDDKELLNQYDKTPVDESFAKRFGFNLLKARFFLDNYIVHHSCEDDTVENNPWKLQYWKKEEKWNCADLSGDDRGLQERLVHLLSMFEVSFTARQRKNYLFYCLLYLFDNADKGLNAYCHFLSQLADKYFWDVYMVQANLNQINVPIPGCFDQVLLPDRKLNVTVLKENSDFCRIYGDGTIKSKGIPLFIFNYLDYKIWEKYFISLRGQELKKENPIRKAFFDELGCSDFELKYFDQFYFSRTRRSLEHFFPQANVNGLEKLDDNKINCLGNFAMIGNEANSAGSNWSPITKLDHYLDSSHKIKQVSVASLKFIIMMQICKDNQNIQGHQDGRAWIFEDIQKHQEKMLDILLKECPHSVE